MRSAGLRFFYAVKPLVPRRLQLLLRRFRAKRIFRRTTPPYLGDGHHSCAAEGVRWPSGAGSCVLLTHDVETKEGLEGIAAIRALEKRFGFASTWNFVMDRYGPVDRHVKGLQEDGCECGAHGLYHDGRLFQNERTFAERMDRIAGMARDLGIRGFRSPSLLHHMDMLKTIGFDWDSSLPAWDPFQPQGMGCGKYLPFFLNRSTLELPVTLWQDFTLFRELGAGSRSVWIDQADQLLRSRCLVNIIVHPDYYDDEVASAYTLFLEFLSSRGAFVTLPSALVEFYRTGTDHA